jgi:hypothetical protein
MIPNLASSFSAPVVQDLNVWVKNSGKIAPCSGARLPRKARGQAGSGKPTLFPSPVGFFPHFVLVCSPRFPWEVPGHCLSAVARSTLPLTRAPKTTTKGAASD